MAVGSEAGSGSRATPKAFGKGVSWRVAWSCNEWVDVV